MARPRLLCLLIVVFVLGVFAPVLRNGFVGYDDNEYVVDNPHVRTGLTPENVAWAFTESHSNNWHPLTWISHALDVSVFGMQPWGHHLTNWLLHGINTALLFWWLYGVSSRLWPSVFVALGFGVHPLHVESVAWIAERKDVLSTLFWMLMLIAYTAWVRRPGIGRYLVVVACFAAGLLSKQMLVTAPVLLLILDRWPLGRTDPLARLVREKIPLFGLSAVFSIIVIQVQRGGGAAVTLEQLPLAMRLSNAVVSYTRYLMKTVYPSNLSVFYPYEGIAWWEALAALAVLTVISLFVWRARVYRPWLAAGWFWFVVTLLPVIGIVQVGMQSMADRYMYVPMIGLLIAVAFEDFDAKAWAVMLAMWSVLAWQQTLVWKDGVTLFRRALEIDPYNFVAHDNLGVELDRRGQFEEAIQEYRETVRLKPGDRQGETNYAHALFAKGERLLAAGQSGEALAVIREGLQHKPRHALAHTLVGRILADQRQFPAALAEFQTALEIDPAFAAAHMGKALALAWAERPAEARSAFEETLRYEPRNAEAHYGLGVTLMVLEQPAEARRHFETAVSLKPDFAAAQSALAAVGGKR